MPFFFSKKGWRNFCQTIKIFLQNLFFGKSFKAWVSLIEKHNVDKNSKHLKKNIIFQIFWIFFEKFCEFFSKEFTAEKFLWNLTLEKFSIFYQSLRDYNCGSNRCMVTCRVSKRISWTRRTFWEICFVADCISGHFMKIWFSTIFDKKIWFLAKYGPFGQFGRPIGQCGQSHINHLDFFTSKKFKILRNSQYILRYLHLKNVPIMEIWRNPEINAFTL